ncbi:MAG: type II toxin-antitoxin system HipA family toxin [Alphaproteobacteria bacterium]|nr:type II toxin-antitoxin system HipA family toxin [Alphaproteobacteria bacterium]MCB9699427.1 type II toxin-antitoxin system HipA family toxin [Alphaproteobacteria bacterium]
MKLAKGQALTVWLRGEAGEERRVGRLAWRDRRAWFEADAVFLASGLQLSPFRLPLRAGVVEAPLEPFDGMFGLFDDSNPDGWGRLLQDRRATALGLSPATLTPLDRLGVVGRTGLGALTYEPELGEPPGDPGVLDLDALAHETEQVLRGAADEVLPELLRLGGSPQGARPKVLVWLRPSDGQVDSGEVAPSPDHRRVLVKFRSRADAEDAGAVEHAYHQLARRAGLDVPDAWLLPSARGAGWFAVERFDRTPTGGHRHVQTLCALLHADHRLPSLDYVGAHAAVHRLTGDQRAVEQLFRRMVFNVVAHNRDDHTKQVSLWMDGAGRWRLAPAYDLTHAEGPGGEHSMAVAGAGEPDLAAILRVAQAAGVPDRRARRIVEEVVVAVVDGWREVAPSRRARERVGRTLQAPR